MTDYTTIIDLIQTAPLIAVFYFLWKSGAIKIGNSKKNGNGYQAQIDILSDHARTSNEEVGKIQKDIVKIKEDIAFIRGKLEK